MQIVWPVPKYCSARRTQEPGFFEKLGFFHVAIFSERAIAHGHGEGSVIKIDKARLRGHVVEVVRSSVEETPNAMLDAEADELAGAKGRLGTWRSSAVFRG